MGRPRTRVAVLDEGERELFRQAFGGATHAYRALRLPESVTYPSFLQAWRGKPMTREVVDAIRDGWENWQCRIVQIVRERQKEPV